MSPVGPIPFLRPRPPRLSRLLAELEALEASGIYSNYGPVNARFEAALTERVFGGRGGCLTVNNATIGLMLGIREAAVTAEGRRYALMPSFTFAATGHAAVWAGLTPLLCDIDPQTWGLSPDAENDLLQRYADHIACVVPYACFGNGIDLQRYARLSHEHGFGVVVDAAASLGSIDDNGLGFGAGFPHALVYSMHATKLFATAEGGVIHSGDSERLRRLRVMGNFGLGEARAAIMPGLNSKLSEFGALMGLARLEELEATVKHRDLLASAYRALLQEFETQRPQGATVAYQFMNILLPTDRARDRPDVVAGLERRGIGCRHYFSPHLAEQPYFAAVSVTGDLTVTNQIASRVLSLPMADTMTVKEVARVSDALRAVLRELT